MPKKICVVGAGRWGKNHIATLHELGALAGIVDSNAGTLQWFTSKYPKIQTHQSVEDALKQNYEAFTLATPAETHFELAKQILTSKKPVLVEKPLALNSSQAQELGNLATQNNTALMVGHVMLFHPAVIKIKELINSDKIGKLQYVYSNRLNLGTVRKEENILWSFAPHDISIFQYLINSDPIEVVSRGGAFVQPHIHDSTMTVLTYPNNLVGHIFVSWLHPFKEHRLVVIGSKGMLSYEDSSSEKALLFYEKGIDFVNGEPVKRDGPTEKIAFENTPPLKAELQYFIDHLDKPQQLQIASAAEGVKVLEILERASAELTADKQSSKEPRPVNQAKLPYFVHPSSFVDQPVQIGEGTKIWHFSHIQSNAQIGTNCSIGQNVNIANNVRIGNFVKIQNNVSVYEGVELEDYVFCGPSMVFTNVNNPRSKYPQQGSKYYSHTLIKEGASLGANCTIVCGHSIGRHAFIAAGAVVTKDVPDYALMQGVPAKQTAWICECGTTLAKLGAAQPSMTCTKCDLGYQIVAGKLSPLPATTSKIKKRFA